MQLQDELYYRINELIPKDPKQPRLLPFSRSTLWLWVKQGRFPAPVKFGPRVTAWKGSVVKKALERLGGE